MKGKVCVPNVEDLRRSIMEEAHGSTKMYQTTKENYWWSDMKRDITKFVSGCLMCQQVKAKHQKPLGIL